MGKKGRKRRSASSDVRPRLAKRNSKRNYLFPMIIVVILAVGGIYLVMGAKQKNDVIADNSVSMAGIVQASDGPYKFRETRTTLSPSLFVGDVAAAYRIAREIPEVIDQLYCYCRCADNFGHKSLLSCYADRHAANCDICMDQARLALQMHKKGKTPAEIQKELDRRFG